MQATGQLLDLPVGEHVAESGRYNSRLDPAWSAFLAEDLHLVVCGRVGALDPFPGGRYVVCGVGSGLR